jgi:FSR family fosmidomycin resistance protein-like MFS transporter
MTRDAIAQTAHHDIEVISLVGAAHGVSHFFQLVIPPLFPWLMPEFGLNFTQAGSLTAVFFVVSGFGQAPGGFIVDHFGARRVLLVAMALFVLAALVLGSAQNYPALLLAAALAGAGNSVFHPADFTLLNRNVSHLRLGHAFSVHGLSGNIGWALAPALMTGIAVTADWRTAAFSAALIAAAAFALIVVRRDTMTESQAHMEADAAKANSTFGFLASGAVWSCFMFFFFITVAFGALQNFAPSAFQQVYGLSLAAGATALTTYLFAGVAGIIYGGFLVARSEAHDQRIAVVLATAAALLLVIASGRLPPWSVALLMAFAGFANGIAGPSRDMLVRRAAIARFGMRALGRVYGFVYSGLDTGMALAPPLFGMLMDAGRFKWALAGIALMQGLAVVTALRVGRTSV